jgi:O-antigen/teichoic acid export membrane protein
VLARALTPTQFGAYGVGFLLLHLGRAFQEGLIVQPMSALGPSLGRPERRVYLSGSALLQVGLALAGAIACAGVGWVLIELGNTIAGPTLFALWFPVLFAQLQEFLRRVFYIEGQVGLAVLNSLTSNGVRLAITVAALAAGADSGTVGLYAIGWGGLAGILLALISTRKLWVRRGVAWLETWRRNWRFGRWVLGSTAANWVAVEVYPILTAGLVSFAATGAYRALQNVVAPVHSLLRAMDTYFTPRLAERRRIAGSGGVAHMVGRMFLVTGPVVAAILVVGVYFAEPILRLLYGETYVGFAPGMGLMALFYALWYAFWPIQSALKAVERTRPIFTASLLATFAMFTVGGWMILQWGVYGTIAGQALSAAIMAAVLWVTWLRWLQTDRMSTHPAPVTGSSPAGPA